ncbi:MAG TPA: hypothetical protein EYG01_02540 [Flavobacteriales bacterium]|jgi:hypothetical protein|nr:hypothetical protein [Flavobacteriales bacterium]
MHDPSELNEIQENAIGVVNQYAQEHIKELRNGSITKTDFYDNLLDSLANYLSVATATLDWLGIKGGVPLDICKDVLTTQRDTLANINIATDTVNGSFKQIDAYEEDMSAEYHVLRLRHMNLRHEGLDFAHDVAHSHLLSTGFNTLIPEEANYLSAKIHPVLGVHAMFESGQWDNLKEIFGKTEPKFFSCFVAACAAMTLVEALTATAAVAGTAASVSTIAKNSSKTWGLPSSTTDWEHIHINNVFASCSSLLDLVENHLDSE